MAPSGNSHHHHHHHHSHSHQRTHSHSGRSPRNRPSTDSESGSTSPSPHATPTATFSRDFGQMDDSTESEAESSSYHEWSDAGRVNKQSHHRASLSSSDDYEPVASSSTPIAPSIPFDQHHHQQQQQQQQYSGSHSRSVSFSKGTTAAHRRMTTTGRPSLHTAGSNISLDTLTPAPAAPPQSTSPYPASILNGSGGLGAAPNGGASASGSTSEAHTPASALSPQHSMIGLSGIASGSSTGAGPSGSGAGAGAGGSGSGGAGYASPAPPYPGEGYNHTIPRIRRKSISHVTPSAGPPSDTSNEDYPSGIPLKGNNKKKRNRDGSFSLPFHRRRKNSNAYPGADWQAWITHPAGPVRKYGPRPRKRYILILILFIAYFVSRRMYREWRKDFDWEITVIPLHGKAEEVEPVLPLKGCFDPKNVSPAYTNSSAAISEAFSQRSGLLSPGLGLGRGSACFDFAATVEDLPADRLVPLTYHTYWRSDLLAFGERQMATIVAFLATQPLSHSKLILWTNGADLVTRSEHIRTLLAKWGQHLEVRQVDMSVLTKGTGLEGMLGGTGGSGLFDERAWVDGDAVRLLVLWHFGGVWMDMDQILTRNLHALMENEFVVQWDCYGEASPFHAYHPDQPFFVLNGALMHFRQHSPYLCEAFHIMASSPPPKPNTFTWGSHLYARLHRRLLAAKIRPFAVLPWCFADPRNCDWDIAFPDPFGGDPEYWSGRRWDGKGEVGRSGREMLEERVGQVWAVHLHNQWGRAFPPGGWVERLLDGYRSKVGILRGHRKEGDKGHGRGQGQGQGQGQNQAQGQAHGQGQRQPGGIAAHGAETATTTVAAAAGGAGAVDANGRRNGAPPARKDEEKAKPKVDVVGNVKAGQAGSEAFGQAWDKALTGGEEEEVGLYKAVEEVLKKD